MQETWVQSLGWKDPLEKGMVTHSIFLPGAFHGQRSLVGYSPGAHKELDTNNIIITLYGVLRIKMYNHFVVHLKLI